MLQRLTLADLEAAILSTAYLSSCHPCAPDLGALTICVLTMKNGLKIVGKSACLNLADFDAEMGKEIARKDAVDQLWQLEGYARADSEYHRVEGAFQSAKAGILDVIAGIERDITRFSSPPSELEVRLLGADPVRRVRFARHCIEAWLNTLNKLLNRVERNPDIAARLAADAELTARRQEVEKRCQLFSADDPRIS